MRFITYSSLFLACLWAGLCPGSTASADVVAGEIIDKTNWEKVEGMVPESVLNWIKKGDYTLKVDELEYDPEAYMTNYDREHFEPNKGKYEFDDEGVIMEVQNGKPADFIEGIPFPVVDVDDPKAGAKIATNHYYHTFTEGNVSYSFSVQMGGARGVGAFGRSGDESVSHGRLSSPKGGQEQGEYRAIFDSPDRGAVRHCRHEHPSLALSRRAPGQYVRIRTRHPEGTPDEPREPL